MSVLWAGNETEAFVTIGTPAENTTAGFFDPTYTRCGLFTGSVGSYLSTPDLPSLPSTIWIHHEFIFVSGNIASGVTVMEAYDSAGTAVFRLRTVGTNTYQTQYWNSATWVGIGDGFVLDQDVRFELDLKLVCGASGSVAAYIGRGLFHDTSADLSAISNVKNVRWHGISVVGYISQCIVADESTVGWKYMTDEPVGAGANTAWTGDHTAVDEAIHSTADFIEATAANDVETFTHGALSIPGLVRAVIVSGAAKQAPTGPQNIQAALRRGGTNYFSGNLSIGAGFAPAQAVFETDPSTGLPWVTVDAASTATEFGFKAIA